MNALAGLLIDLEEALHVRVDEDVVQSRLRFLFRRFRLVLVQYLLARFIFRAQLFYLLRRQHKIRDRGATNEVRVYHVLHEEAVMVDYAAAE